ncbi:MAG: alpha/beta hydrolase [Sulfuricella sp.]
MSCESELSAETGSKEVVVLVHGLWMSGWVMRLLGLRLRRCGFHVAVFSYPSLRCSLSQSALRLSRFAAGLDAARVHFVGHSLGGLVVVQMLADCPQTRAGRVVLMGTPYRASHVARKLSRTALGKWLVGRGMAQWLDQHLPVRAAQQQQYEAGVISGYRSLGSGKLLGGLPRPNDGVVAVEETLVPGTRDQILLKVSHSGMLVSAGVARQVCAFLKHGHFLREQS